MKHSMTIKEWKTEEARFMELAENATGRQKKEYNDAADHAIIKRLAAMAGNFALEMSVDGEGLLTQKERIEK